MSSCLSGGGGAAYGFDLELLKSPSTSTIRTPHNTPSPTSTVSESNSPITISTRKPRTPRKRPNQTYNEAAALLSTAYPTIFSASNLTNTSNQKKYFKNSPKRYDGDFSESSELLLRFPEETDFLVHPFTHSKPSLSYDPKIDKRLDGAPEHVDFDDDFDAESILDEDVEEGIESIMGNSGSDRKNVLNDKGTMFHELNLIGNYFPMEKLGQSMRASWRAAAMGLGFGADFDLGFGLRNALRNNDDANWWRFPTVDFEQISPRLHERSEKDRGESKKVVAGASASDKKKNKKKKKEKAESKSTKMVKNNPEPDPSQKARSGLLLQLNYEEVLEAWSDRASPFCDEDGGGNDVHARLAQIELFPDDGGAREACVLRYREKRRTRLFSKKIRYEVRKVNADQRPRMKGRFVRATAKSQR